MKQLIPLSSKTGKDDLCAKANKKLDWLAFKRKFIV